MTCACEWKGTEVVSACGAHMQLFREMQKYQSIDAKLLAALKKARPYVNGPSQRAFDLLKEINELLAAAEKG